jgi:hypothetical protein
VEVRPGRPERLAATALLALCGGVFLCIFYERYWRWRHCFNDRGRCWDPVSEQVFLEQAGIVWGVPAAFFLIAAAAVALWPVRR